MFAALAGGLLYFLNAEGAPLWKYRLESGSTALSASEKGNCACASDDRGRVVCLTGTGVVRATPRRSILGAGSQTGPKGR